MSRVGELLADDHPRALAVCYRELGGFVRGHLCRWVAHDDIDDVVQTVFLDVWRTRGRYDPTRSVEAWVLAITRRRAIDHLRTRRHPTTSLEQVADPCGDDGRDLADALDRVDRVQRALAVLPPAQREAIELAYYYDLSQREIAEQLRIPLGTIKARTARGLRRLAGLLVTEADGGEPP